MGKALRRFYRYLTTGVSTFIFDLALLFWMIDCLKINYVLSTGVAFFIAISINYFISRRFVFKNTLRSVHEGYALFVVIAGIGMVAVMCFMSILVGVFQWHYLIARILIACFVGFWNYLMNLYVNFKVAGKE